jgi:hypothetical protein
VAAHDLGPCQVLLSLLSKQKKCLSSSSARINDLVY